MSSLMHDCLLYLLDVSARSAVLALLVAGTLWCLRTKDYNVRHRTWCVVLVAMLLLPLGELLAPSIQIPSQVTSLFQSFGGPAGTDRTAQLPVSSDIEGGITGDSTASFGNRDSEFVAREDANAHHTGERTAASNEAALFSGDAEWLSRIWPALLSTAFAVYAVVALALIGRLMVAVWTASKVIRTCRPIDPAASGRSPVCECDAVNVPLTAGVFRPRVLLPRDWRSWDGDLLKSVLQHEQAHIDRRDNLVTFLAELNRCFYWFHPLAWFLRRELARLAELTCDDYAMAGSSDRPRYAEHLLEIAHRVTGSPQRFSVGDIFMARTSQVASRIDSILEANRPLSRRLSRWRGAIAILVATSLLVTAAGLRAGQSPDTSSSSAPSAATARQSVEENAAAPTRQGPHDVYGDPLPDGAIARLGTTRLRQAGSGWKRIAFLPNSSQFVVGGASNPCRVWDARTGKVIHRFDFKDAQMHAFCVSPADGAVATLVHVFRGDINDMQMQLVVWNPGTWSERSRITWKDRPQVRQIAFSPDGKTIAMQQRDGALRLCSVTQENTVQRPSPFRGEVESIEFSPSGNLLATAGRQGVLLWDLKTDEEPEKLSGISQGAGVVRFSPDGKLLAAGCYDALTRIFDVESRKVMLLIANVDRRHSTEGMCFSPDGAQLIIPNTDNSVEFFDVQTAERVRMLRSQAIQPLGVAVSSAGDLLACIGPRSAIDVWDLKASDRISEQWIGHVDPPTQLAFASQDRQLITAGFDGLINFWDAETSRLDRTLHHDNWVTALAVSPRGDLLLTCGLDDSIRLWDMVSGKEKFRLTGHGRNGGSQTTSVAFSADGARFYSFGMDLILRASDTATGKVLAEHPIRPKGVTIDVGEDGRPVATGDPFAEGAGGFQFNHAMLTASGSHLLIGGRAASKISVFDCATGRETDAFTTDGALQGFAVSPDGKTILTMEEDKPAAGDDSNRRSQRTILRLRDFTSKQTRREVALPGRYSYRMAISSDGTLLAFTCSKVDANNFSRWYRLSVLDLKTLKEVAGKTIEWDSIRQLAFAHSGRLLAAAYADTPVLLWDLDRLRTAQATPP